MDGKLRDTRLRHVVGARSSVSAVVAERSISSSVGSNLADVGRWLFHFPSLSSFHLRRFLVHGQHSCGESDAYTSLRYPVANHTRRHYFRDSFSTLDISCSSDLYFDLAYLGALRPPWNEHGHLHNLLLLPPSVYYLTFPNFIFRFHVLG